MPPAKTWTLGIPPIEICGIKMGHRRQGKTDTTGGLLIAVLLNIFMILIQDMKTTTQLS
jgi:hypothetical protein